MMRSFDGASRRMGIQRISQGSLKGLVSMNSTGKLSITALKVAYFSPEAIQVFRCIDVSK
jgi:hypothetical protein